MSEAKARLIDAMDILIPVDSRGAAIPLTKERLYRLAGVSRATMNRHPEVLKEWDRRVGTVASRAGGNPRKDQTDLLKERIGVLIETVQSKTTELSLAATVIATLHAENQSMQAHVNQLNAARVQMLQNRRGGQA